MCDSFPTKKLLPVVADPQVILFFVQKPVFLHSNFIMSYNSQSINNSRQNLLFIIESNNSSKT